MQKYPPRRLLRAVDVFCGDSVHKTDMADRTVLTYPAGKFRVYDYVIRTRDFEYTKVCLLSGCKHACVHLVTMRGPAAAA